MNILFLSPQPYPYGMAASKRIRLFAEYLAVKNTVNVCVCGKNNGSNANYGEKDNVNWKLIKFGRFEYFLNPFKVKSIVKKHYKSDDKNILMLYDGIGLTNFLFSVFAKKLGYKVVTDVVEDYSVHEENTGLLLSILHKVNIVFDKKISFFSDGIITISKRLYQKYSQHEKNQRLVLIPISAENVNQQYQEKKNKEYFEFVYSGSYGKKDGIDILLIAFFKIIERYKNVRLVLSGKISEEISRMINEKKYIEYVGMIPDNKYYKFLFEADVLLMTRIDTDYANSGFPFKLGEYLASGNPVIATDVSDVSDYLIDKENALIAQPSNISSLYNKMEYAILKQEKCKEIGLKGKEIAGNYFNPEINGRNLEKFLITI